jgi:hypothetical protein
MGVGLSQGGVGASAAATAAPDSGDLEELAPLDRDAFGLDLSAGRIYADCGTAIASNEKEHAYLAGRAEYSCTLEDVFGGAPFERARGYITQRRRGRAHETQACP